VAKKKRGAPETVEDERPSLNVRLLVVGAIVVVIAVILGSIIGTVLLVGVDDDDPAAAAVPEFIADAPEIERSSVADLLESTSFEDMTLEQREAAFDEFDRVLANAEFRMHGLLHLGIDIVRLDGTTMILRQYGVTEAPGGDTPTEVTRFYCPGPDGTIDTYETIRTGVSAPIPSYNRIDDGDQPLERALSDVNLTEVTDLGVEEIDGRRARGVRFIYNFSETEPRATEAWFDIENGRVYSYQQFDAEGNPSVLTDYDFDWRVPPRIEPDPALAMPPCYDGIYS
jgi:hypothetical protein